MSTAMRTKRARTGAVAALAALLVAACSPPPAQPADGGETSEEGATVATATSAEEAGGFDALVKAAQEEGELNVIALPPDWANYGEIIETFSEKYDIKVNSAQPDGSSQDEINAVNQLKGTDRAPDVLDLGAAVALANTDLFAPYQVQTWDTIPDAQKDPDGLWVQDYGGYMSIGYDSAKVPEITALSDLTKPEFKNKVALNGDPTQANAALHGVMMASLANGGSLDDIGPGIDFFANLQDTGNFIPVQASSATVESGETPVVFDWDYLSAAAAKNVPTWKVFVPSDAVLGGYYFQAINKDAPHPAAARLWQEFLYSDEGQNLWLEGGARPVRMEAMREAGTLDEDAAAALPEADGEPQFLSEEQAQQAKDVLAKDWAGAIG
ncbi:putative spermidine/putrescine transport system substrate-binding protein [Kineococcus xinjiangensis]|uniref:Putative spermidine/putrescine transport system substrate-binding protein n=1 Tax=Kineococcus xinjiangensis TaxID=512762 RepID=A0A2S6IXI7_9ACTN|nr:ABC transporter substrate-binding protein [Kineococcus xinjiangensis]PPK98861.1 putative spermidine/putrescine transport system substrate-binding protein [Kineococcus xinjiangensis]